MKSNSLSGRIFCAQVDGDWTRCVWRSCMSHLRPPWGGTCPGTEAGACCHGTPLYTANRKNTYKWGSSSPEFTERVTQLLHNDSLVPVIAPTHFSYTLGCRLSDCWTWQCLMFLSIFWQCLMAMFCFLALEKSNIHEL